MGATGSSRHPSPDAGRVAVVSLVRDAIARASRSVPLDVTVPVALLVVAAAARETRLIALGLLVAGFLSARLGGRRNAAWAAALPVAVSLAWGIAPQPHGAASGADCASVTSPPAAWRLVEAILALATLALTAVLIRSGREELGLRYPGRALTVVAVTCGIIAAAIATIAGPAVAAPFFGAFRLDQTNPVSYLPAAVFATSNGVMEELAYRGALLGWLGRVTRPEAALGVQAIVFGIAHAGPDVVGGALPLVVLMAAGGLIAGLLVRRTGSLALPLALHVAFDLPLYFYWACRVG